MITQSPIANCTVQFRFECPKLWENLDPTADPDIRFCHTCRKDIYRCHTMEQVYQHALDGDCIAVSDPGAEIVERIGEVATNYNPQS
jgi:hypothetical protein